MGVFVEHVLADGTIKEKFEMADGVTLEVAARTINPDTEGKFAIPVLALVGSRPAVKELGDWEFALSDGARVQFREIVMGGGGGGGSNPIQIVLMVAVAALATMIVGPFASGFFGAFLGNVAVGELIGWAIAGGMILGSAMLMGALFQNNPSMPSGHWDSQSAAAASPTYNINSSGNQARLYQPEPEGFGRMKIVPDFCAQTWTQYIGNDQIGYFVYSVGRGHYDIESLQFGETVFWRNGRLVEDSGYDIQNVQIVEPGEAVTIFPDNVITSNEVSGQELFAPNNEEYTGAIGPYITNPPGTTINKLLLDFVFQSGLGYYNDRGGLETYSVTWAIEYQKVDDFGNALSEWVTLDTPTVSGATLTPQRMTMTYNVNGRYAVRCRRTSNTRGDGRTMDKLMWGAMRGMLPGTYKYPITCVAFSVKANNALTQNASRQFSVIATRKLPVYNRATKTWSIEQPTRSWAAAISSLLKCEWGGRITDENIDLDTLWAIDERLQAKGWYYDAYIDGAYLVWTLLCEMCQAECVVPRIVGPVVSFVEDMPNRTPTFALTPRNIMRNTFAVNYVTWGDDTPDDVVIDYLDSDYGFHQRDVTATLPESESREPSSLSILGITNRNHAHKVAVAYAAHNRWQRVVVECQVENLGRVINKGDICTVAHPRFKNTAAGIVRGWTEMFLEVGLTFDMRKKPENTTDNQEYYISFTKLDGSVWGPCKLAGIDFDAGTCLLDATDYSTLLLQGQDNPFEFFSLGHDSTPTTWTLYTSKNYQRLMIVDSVTSQDALHYDLKLLNYDNRIYQYDNLEAPKWQGRGQLPEVTTMDTPDNFNGIIQSKTSVLLVWGTVARAEYYEVETSANGSDWIFKGRSNVNQLLVDVLEGKYYARVRACSETLQSGWARFSGDTTLVPPEAPQNLKATDYVGASATVSWDVVQTAKTYRVSLYAGTAETPFLTTETSEISFEITPENQTGGPYRSLTVAVDAVGDGGTSAASKVTLNDEAPTAPSSAEYTVENDSVTLSNVVSDISDDIAGYVLAKGVNANFDANQIIELRQTSTLPYVWSGLEAGIHYFRIAIKDAFYEITRNALSLNWSGVLEITIGEATEDVEQG